MKFQVCSRPVQCNGSLAGSGSSAIVQRQRLWDQIGDLNNGGFLAHRNPKESEDEPEILRPTHAGTSQKKLVRDIRRATRKHHSAEDKIRIVLEGLRGEESIAALCRREAIAESLYYAWSKEFLEAGKHRLAGDAARASASQ